MSLHLGNLSPRVRIDELERVFKRFGRCNVRVKDRFGFVVYDVPGNAEKALRTLRGEKICGQSISLSWSNRQPRSLQRTAKGVRSYNSDHKRSPVRENNVNRKLGSDGRRDFRLGFKPQDADDRRLSSADIPEETTKHDQEIDKSYAYEKDENTKEDLVDEGGGTKSILLDSDRWEEQVGNLANENDMENGLDFDRYEPYHGNGDDKRDKNEMNHVDHQGGSPAVEDSQDKTRVIKSGEPNLPGNMKSKQTCYICGDLGHKMHSCPRAKDDKRKKSRSSGIFGRISTDRSGDDKMIGGGKGEYKSKRADFKARESQQPGRDDVMVRAHKSDRNSSRSRKLRQTHGENSPAQNVTNRTRTNRHWQNKRRRENGSPERQHTKKLRSFMLTPVSNYEVSKSKTERSASRFNSRSRLRSRSLSSLSSSSTSHPTRSGEQEPESRLRSTSKLKSKSRSRSRSRSTACLSLSASVSRSLSSSPNKGQMMGIESKGVSLGLREGVKTDSGSGNSKLQSVTIVVDSVSATPFKLDEDVNNYHSQKRNDNNLALSMESTDETNIFSAQLEKADPTGGHLPPNDPQNCDLFISNHVLTSHVVNSKSITSEDMHMALKHYGLPQPEESEKDLPPETYFGSARLWPWDIIYYRRLRKGPISIENYAWRITQNEEFGIVDKYVRSSSGWSECEERAF